MAIEFNCPHCQSLLRVDDANSGKRARCPHCSVVNRIPGERLAPPVATPPVSQQFFIDSVSGATFGPVTKQELEQWVTDGRVSASCVIRATGERTGQPATIYYPNLGRTEEEDGKTISQDDSPTLAPLGNPYSNPEPTATEFDIDPHGEKFANHEPVAKPTSNPYSAPTAIHETEEFSKLGIRPTQADVGSMFTIAYEVFMKHFGLLFGVGAIIGAVELVSNLVLEMASRMEGPGFALALLTTVVFTFIKIYLTVGQTRISFKLLRGQQAKFSELFDGGDKFLAVVGYTLLITIPLVFGFLLLIVPGIFLVLYFWPSYMLIIENRISVLDSFGVAAKIGERNLLSSFILCLASFGIIILGSLLCYVGMFLAVSYVSLLWVTAYLMMTGELRSR